MYIYSTSSYGYLGSHIADIGTKAGWKFYNGDLVRETFPDGEMYHRFDTKLNGVDVAIVGGTINAEETLELYDMGCAAVKYGARSLNLVIPYFGYSTMDRACKPGEIVKAKTRARLFSSIPLAPNGNRVLMVDLHNEGIPHFFEGGIRPIHVYAKKPVLRLFERLAKVEHLKGSGIVIASTDAGRAKWVQSLADELELDASFVFKRRFSGTQTKIVAVSAHVKNRTVIVYDDMIRTGGSLVAAVQAYYDAGAHEVHAVTTHGLFCANGFDKVAKKVKKLGCTDTHPSWLKFRDHKKLEVTSVAEDLAFALQGIDTGSTV